MAQSFDLPVSTPEEEGVPSRALTSFLDTLEAKGIPMHAFAAIRHGKVIAEGYWRPFHRGQLHRIYSCSKSFVSIAIGFLESEGVISLADRIVSHFPEKIPEGGVHPYLARATIRDLLMMASPHQKTTYKQMDMDDWVGTFFLYPPSHLPGTVFCYDTSATHVLGALVEKKAGMPFLDYLRPRLLDHLGFSQAAHCLRDPVGISWSGSGVLCTLTDLAKVALTCMHGGRFGGRQLIPEAYIRSATSPQISNFVSGSHMNRGHGYGYQFWCYPHGAFAMVGMGGQVALCFPDRDFLLVTNADTQIMEGGEDAICDAVWDTILPHLGDGSPIPSDSREGDALQAKLQRLTLHTVEGEATSLLAPEISEAIYRLDNNDLGWESLSFSFAESGGKLRFAKGAKEWELPFGYGMNVPGKFPEHEYPCLTSGAWWDERTLNIVCYIVGECYAPLRATAFFQQDCVSVYLRNAAELFLEEYSGFACGRRLSPQTRPSPL